MFNIRKKRKKKKTASPQVQLTPEELQALESGDDEVMRRYAERRIRAARKAQRKRKQKRIRRRSLTIIILCLIGMNLVLGGRYVTNLLKAGGTVLDGDAPIVETARTQLGNYGGKKFWQWYGFDSHVDWCACFVSWCADQNGLIDDGKVPMSCYVPQQVNWFRDRDRSTSRETGTRRKPGTSFSSTGNTTDPWITWDWWPRCSEGRSTPSRETPVLRARMRRSGKEYASETDIRLRARIFLATVW